MENILEKIALTTRKRIEDAKAKCSMVTLQSMVEQKSEEEAAPSFFNALKAPGISFICEVKKASPSKGLIDPAFPYVEIAKDYESAGANCISVLTEPKWFLGKNEYLEEITKSVSIPCIRKDFTFD